MARFWRLRNEYMTVVTWPGWTSTEACSGLKSQGPRTLASNSIVTVRLASTWPLRAALAPVPACVSERAMTLRPSALQTAR